MSSKDVALSKMSEFAQKCRLGIERIRALIHMQMGDRMRKLTKAQERRRIFIIFLLVLAIGAITGAVIGICALLQSMFYLPLGRNMLASVLLLTQLVAVVGGVGTIQRVLFTDRENSMLLTFPCTFSDIVLSKLAIFFINELKRNCFFLLPFLLGFAIATGQGFTFYAFIPLAYAILSVLPVFISCALAVAWLYLKRIIEKSPIFSVLGLVVLFVAIIFLAKEILAMLPNPLQLLQKYGQYIKNISLVADKVAEYTLHYGALASLLMGSGNVVDFAVLAVSSVAIAVVGISILLPFYFRAVSSSAEHSPSASGAILGKGAGKKASFAKKPLSLYLSFLRKEVILTVRDTQKLNATVTSFFVLPIVSYVMNYILDAINTNPLGDYIVIAFNVMISASLLSAFNTDCASALSAEGLEFCVLKTAPSNTMAIAWAKITVTLLSNFVAISATAVMLYFTTGISLINLALMMLTLILVAAGVVLWSFQLDVRKPQFAEYASKGASGVVDNPNVAMATLLGFITATLAGALTLLLLYDDYVTGWLRIIGIVLAFCVARVFLFYRNLQVYFHEIEL